MAEAQSAARRHPRYLKDVNNQFHQGAAISFYELVTGVQSVDEAPWVEFGFVVAVVQLDEMRWDEMRWETMSLTHTHTSHTSSVTSP